MSIAMAIVDYIPVLFFLLSAVLLQRDLYNKMSKGAFALFSAGTLMVVFAGGYKATWKLLYASGACDFRSLSQCFMPMQATGFFLVAASLAAMFFFRQGKNTVYSAAPVPALFAGTMLFVPMMCFGIGTIFATLGVFAAKLKRKWLIPFMVLGFIALLAMGYLSTKDFSNPAMNWAAEFVNIAGQGLLLMGAVVLHKAGLGELVLNKNK